MAQWRPVVGFEGYYEIADDGQVRGCQRTVGAANGKTKVIKAKPMNLMRARSGHLALECYKDAHRQRFMVHRLVLMTFIGPCPEGMEACHRNGNPAENRVENLYWGTRSDNVRDAIEHGTHHWAARTHCGNGHEFTPENTRPRSSGTGRECIACYRIWKQNFNTKRRERRRAAKASA
jgi:hypothetical protein